jgi:NAD+ diphosphatase
MSTDISMDASMDVSRSIKSNLYAGGGLDRAAPRRKDAAWVATKLTATDSRLVPVWRSQSLIDVSNPGAPRLCWLPTADGPDLTRPGVESALLGLDGDTAWFAIDLSVFDNPEQHPHLAGRGQFVELRTVGALLPRTEAHLAAYARGLFWWHQRHRHCGVCGHLTLSAEAGHVRICTNAACAAHHFPRTDPAVIMLVHHGDRCLLGRQPRFPPGLYSTLAGFVEPGESVEEAVAREVFEETGIRITDLRYHSSQPWPFPSSLMLGFLARAVTTDITVQPEEMEDARWFHRDQLLSPDRVVTPDDPLRQPLLLPRADSISRQLIEDWLRL